MITPSTTVQFSMEPQGDWMQEFAISATVMNTEATFDCNAVLYDSQNNEIDNKTFSFSATAETVIIE